MIAGLLKLLRVARRLPYQDQGLCWGGVYNVLKTHRSFGRASREPVNVSLWRIYRTDASLVYCEGAVSGFEIPRMLMKEKDENLATRQKGPKLVCECWRTWLNDLSTCS